MNRVLLRYQLKILMMQKIPYLIKSDLKWLTSMRKTGQTPLFTWPCFAILYKLIRETYLQSCLDRFAILYTCFTCSEWDLFRLSTGQTVLFLFNFTLKLTFLSTHVFLNVFLSVIYACVISAASHRQGVLSFLKLTISVLVLL